MENDSIHGRRIKSTPRNPIQIQHQTWSDILCFKYSQESSAFRIGSVWTRVMAKARLSLAKAEMYSGTEIIVKILLNIRIRTEEVFKWCNIPPWKWATESKMLRIIGPVIPRTKYQGYPLPPISLMMTSLKAKQLWEEIKSKTAEV